MKLNFDALLYSFGQIAFGEKYDENDAIRKYDAIPLNSKEIFHVVIRNCRLRSAAGMISLDIALNHEPVAHSEGRSFLVADMGDLSTFNAYHEVDGLESELDQVELNTKANIRIGVKNGKIINFENGICKELNFE
jgi:hypothetical protein